MERCNSFHRLQCNVWGGIFDQRVDGILCSTILHVHTNPNQGCDCGDISTVDRWIEKTLHTGIVRVSKHGTSDGSFLFITLLTVSKMCCCSVHGLKRCVCVTSSMNFPVLRWEINFSRYLYPSRFLFI